MRAETLDVACTDVEPARRAQRRAALALLLCAACSAGAGGWTAAFAAQGTAEADAPTEVGGPAEGAAPVAGLSPSDAANIVRQAYGGRIVSVVEATLDARSESGERVHGHQVRVDVDGRVKTVFVDASGRIHEDAASTPRGTPGRPE